MKLFVDDERPAPRGWVLATSSKDAIEIMQIYAAAGCQLDAVSLDHDLSTVMYEDDTTRPIVERMRQHNWWPIELYVHTANPDGEDWLVEMARKYAPAGTLKGYGCNFWGTCKVDSQVQIWET